MGLTKNLILYLLIKKVKLKNVGNQKSIIRKFKSEYYEEKFNKFTAAIIPNFKNSLDESNKSIIIEFSSENSIQDPTNVEVKNIF